MVSTDPLGCILYGCYVVLLFQSLYVLKRQKQNYRRIQVLLLTALFILSTASLAVTLAINGLKERDRFLVIVWAPVVRLSLLFVANLIADSILLWRCYVVWDKRRKVIALPMILCLANHVLALVVICRFRGGWQFGQYGADYDLANDDLRGLELPDLVDRLVRLVTSNYTTCGLYLGTALTNMLLTIMIAGRLVFISRRTRAILGPKHGDLYRLIVDVTIESGLLYPVILITYAACTLGAIEQVLEHLHHGYFTGESPSLWLTIMGDVIQEAIIHALGISQTLIIVRIALGLSFSSVDEAVSTFRANAKQSSAETPGSVLDICPRNRPIFRRHSFNSLRPSDTGSNRVWKEVMESVQKM